MMGYKKWIIAIDCDNGNYFDPCEALTHLLRVRGISLPPVGPVYD